MVLIFYSRNSLRNEGCGEGKRDVPESLKVEYILYLIARYPGLSIARLRVANFQQFNVGKSVTRLEPRGS